MNESAVFFEPCLPFCCLDEKASYQVKYIRIYCSSHKALYNLYLIVNSLRQYQPRPIYLQLKYILLISQLLHMKTTPIINSRQFQFQNLTPTKATLSSQHQSMIQHAQIKYVTEYPTYRCRHRYSSLQMW